MIIDEWQPLAQSLEKDKIEIAFCRCMARDIAPCIVTEPKLQDQN